MANLILFYAVQIGGCICMESYYITIRYMYIDFFIYFVTPVFSCCKLRKVIETLWICLNLVVVILFVDKSVIISW